MSKDHKYKFFKEITDDLGFDFPTNENGEVSNNEHCPFWLYDMCMKLYNAGYRKGELNHVQNVKA